MKYFLSKHLRKIINNVEHYENFPVASILLPKELRKAVYTIYKFARNADDISDEGEALPYKRLQALNLYSNYLKDITNNNLLISSPKLFIDLNYIIKKHNISIQYLHDLLKAFKQDIMINSYNNKQQVLNYCKFSANPVGRILLQIYKCYDNQNNIYSDAICTSLQLINFYQDAAIDYKKKRFYISRETLCKYGLSHNSISEMIKHKNPKNHTEWKNWQNMMFDEVHFAQRMLLSGLPLCKNLPIKISLEIKCIIYGANEICNKLHKNKYEVFNNRPVLKWYNWFTIIYKALFN